MIEAKHFKLEELIDKDSFGSYGHDAWNLFSHDAIYMIDGIREFFGKPVTVNNWLWGGNLQYRGYRPPHCTVGAPNSYHRRGQAFDFDVKGMAAEEARRHIIENQYDPLLIWIERLEGGTSWVHADTALLHDGKKRIYLFNP